MQSTRTPQPLQVSYHEYPSHDRHHLFIQRLMGSFRLLLAIAVFIVHSKPLFGLKLVSSDMAVEGFYILSGFYMALVLNEKYNKPDSYGVFIRNRIIRLWPAYLVILIVSAVTSLIFHIAPYEAWKHLPSFTDIPVIASAVLSNIFVIGQDASMFLGISPTSGHFFLTSNVYALPSSAVLLLLVPTAWTLAVEFWFYLIAPFIVRKHWKAIALLAIAAIALRFILQSQLHQAGDPWSYRYFPFELPLFLIGALSYKLSHHLNKLRIRKVCSQSIWALLLVMTAIIPLLPLSSGWQAVIFYSIIFSCIPFIFLATRNSKIDRFVGELTYPVYLSHFLFLTLNEKLDLHFSNISVLVFTILFSSVIILTIERPLLKYRTQESGTISVLRRSSVGLLWGLGSLSAGTLLTALIVCISINQQASATMQEAMTTIISQSSLANAAQVTGKTKILYSNYGTLSQDGTTVEAKGEVEVLAEKESFNAILSIFKKQDIWKVESVSLPKNIQLHLSEFP